MLIGLDEVGRGALAGPVMVGAAATPFISPVWTRKVKDSKLLTRPRREALFEEIRESNVPWAVGMATVTEIDKSGIDAAVSLAAQRAFASLLNMHLHLKDVKNIVIDGGTNWLDRPVECLIKADQTVWEVSVASICAKVVRDGWMMLLSETDKFKGWGFETNSGYGTKSHIELLTGLNPRLPSDIHRRTFRPVSVILSRSRGV